MKLSAHIRVARTLIFPLMNTQLHKYMSSDRPLPGGGSNQYTKAYRLNMYSMGFTRLRCSTLVIHFIIHSLRHAPYTHGLQEGGLKP